MNLKRLDLQLFAKKTDPPETEIIDDPPADPPKADPPRKEGTPEWAQTIIDLLTPKASVEKTVVVPVPAEPKPEPKPEPKTGGFLKWLLG